MSNNKSVDRLSFLAEKYNIFDDTDKGMSELVSYLTLNSRLFTNLTSKNNFIFALISYEAYDLEGNLLSNESGGEVKLGSEAEQINLKYKGNKSKVRVDISFDVFNKMVDADPSRNKMYTQWMLNTFTRYIKSGEYSEAERFFSEDLPLAKDYLRLFESNKRKKKFKELTKNSFVLKGVKDPTDINQYKSLSQLYDAVDPFIDKDPSNIEKLINGFVDDGKALVPVRDRRFTLYIPKCKAASVIFDEFVGWCTAKQDGGMFEHYRGNGKYRKPNGEKSDIYIVIDNRFFSGELKTNYLYQVHFESEQVRDRIQSSKNNFFEDVMLKSEGISNFFHDELKGMLGMKKNIMAMLNVTDNVYVKYLIKFGWTEALFDIIEEYTPIIRFTNRDVPRLPDISRFKNLTTLVIRDAKLSELHPSIGNLDNLQELLVPDNKLTAIPSEIGKLKNLVFLNILGNKIKSIPDDIKYLDKANGGSLHRIAFNIKDIGEVNYRKLKKLLPSSKM